jgi:hypothetical protein
MANGERLLRSACGHELELRLRLGRCDTLSLEAQGSQRDSRRRGYWRRVGIVLGVVHLQEFVVKLGPSHSLLYPASARQWRLRMRDFVVARADDIYKTKCVSADLIHVEVLFEDQYNRGRATNSDAQCAEVVRVVYTIMCL